MTAIAGALTRRPEIRLSKGLQFALLFAVGALLFVVFQGTANLEHNDRAPLFATLNGVRDWVDANRTINPVFVYVLGPIRGAIDVLDDVVTFVLDQFSWLGLMSIAGAVSLAFVSWRTAVLVTGSLLVIGLLGLWTETLQTLVLIANSVALSLAIGIPLGILAGRNDRFLRFITPILDFMQIMPTFAYLSPLTLIFLIGPASAVIATLIYAMPPAIRITALGIRGVPGQTVEAATSLGATGSQVLRKVQLADRPAHDRPGREPDDHDGALDHRHRRAHQRARSRRIDHRGDPGSQVRRRGHGGGRDRPARDGARPDHRQRE